MFLYNPTDDYSVDEECMKNNDTVYSYLIKKHNSILDIYNIEDPFWKSEKKIENIINQIEKIVKGL